MDERFNYHTVPFAVARLFNVEKQDSNVFSLLIYVGTFFFWYKQEHPGLR